MRLALSSASRVRNTAQQAPPSVPAIAGGHTAAVRCLGHPDAR